MCRAADLAATEKSNLFVCAATNDGVPDVKSDLWSCTQSQKGGKDAGASWEDDATAVFEFPVAAGPAYDLHFQVFDYDKKGEHQFLGRARLSWSDARQQAAASPRGKGLVLFLTDPDHKVSPKATETRKKRLQMKRGRAQIAAADTDPGLGTVSVLVQMLDASQVGDKVFTKLLGETAADTAVEYRTVTTVGKLPQLLARGIINEDNDIFFGMPGLETWMRLKDAPIVTTHAVVIPRERQVSMSGSPTFLDLKY